MLRKIIVLLAAAIVAWKAYELAWPLVDSEGALTTGSYRGFEIGSTKAEILTELYSSFQSTRLDGYQVGDQSYVVPTLDIPDAPLAASDKWFLTYPGLHKETIVLTFERDQLASIRYRRDMVAP
jgi:hypothetical protein